MTVYLSLGSNRGDRAAYLAVAIAALPGHGIRVERVSTMKETEPVGATGRARFWNCVVEATTELLPQVLLRRLRAIEFSHGRRRGGAPRSKRLPRTLDLDLILYGKAQVATTALTIPHPRFAQRGFVLDGLAEIAPKLRAPGASKSMRQAKTALGKRRGRC